ncbi:MAG: hypothetical protein J6T80_06075 [Paludibacteraceae bacterium]|nr:hypothetical protein [Paludibacteraceae bacterium]
MKKILVSLIALVMCNMMSWGTVNISVSPKEIDFGTVQLKNGEAEPDDWATATLNYTLATYVYNVFIDTVGTISPNCEFSAVADSGEDFWYDSGYGSPETTVWVSFYATAAGDYSIKYHFYSWDNYNWENKVYGDELTVKVKVVDQATGIDEEKAKVESRKELRDGQVLIMRKGEVYSVTGERL